MSVVYCLIVWQRRLKNVLQNKLIKKVVNTLFGSESTIIQTIQDVPLERRFFVIPGSLDLRWIVPQNPETGWPALRQWRPYDFASRTKWLVVTLLYRAGLLGHVPGIVNIGVVDGKLPEMPNMSTADTVPVIYIGTKGLHRKLVVSLVSIKTKQPLVVLKIPLGIGAKEKIHYEADVLVRLAREKPGLSPILIHEDEQKGISFQSVIGGSQARRGLSTGHIDFLCSLVIKGQEISLDDYWGQLGARVARLGGVANEDRRFINQLIQKYSSTELLPAVWAHGDFTTWNLMLMSTGQLAAVDWEDAKRQVLPLVDLVHFCFMETYQSGERNIFPPLLAKPFIRHYMQRLGIPKDMECCLIFAGLVHVWIQVSESGDKYGRVPLALQIIRSLQGNKV